MAKNLREVMMVGRTTTDLYFEAHVTIEPVLEGLAAGHLKFLVEKWKFKVADLLMQKRNEDTPERSKFDTFCSSRDKNYGRILSRTIGLIEDLKENGFKVWRYKIENTVVDSKTEDKYGLIS